MNEWLDENDVSLAVVDWLKNQGYEARALKAGEQGFDVAAWHPRNGHRWAIESKGSTSSKIGTKRHGSPGSEGSAYGGVSKAFLNAISWTGVGVLRDTSIGIATPSDRYFNMWLDRIAPACGLLGIAIFRVSRDGVLAELPPNQLPNRPSSLAAPARSMPKSLRRNFPFPPYDPD